MCHLLQFPHSPAFKDGRIRAGDKILAINGLDVSNAKQDFVYLTLQGCKGVVKLTIGHPLCTAPPRIKSGPQQQRITQQQPPAYQTGNLRDPPLYPEESGINRGTLPQYPPPGSHSMYPQSSYPQAKMDNRTGFSSPIHPPPYPSGHGYYGPPPPHSYEAPHQQERHLVHQTSFPPPSYSSYQAASGKVPISEAGNAPRYGGFQTGPTHFQGEQRGAEYNMAYLCYTESGGTSEKPSR